MSGKKQHHIPRSVQRGFLFDAKAEKTYVHRRGGAHFPASIADVAAQRYFYSRLSTDGSKTLDDMITDYEDRLGGLLIELRGAATDCEVKAETAAEVIAPLTPRGANMRRIFGSGIQQLMTAAAEAFADEDTVSEMLGLAEPAPNPTWNAHWTKTLDGSPKLKALLSLVPIPTELLDRVIFMLAKEHLSGTYDETMFGVAQTFETMLARLDDLVCESHNKALSQSLVAEPRMKSLEVLQWHIRDAPPEGAILPDCVAIALDGAGGTFLPYMMAKLASVAAVVMPITSQKLLVGVRPGHAQPDLVHFNRDAAACSDELFITASSNPVFAELGANMGARWNGEIDAVIQGVLKNVLPSKPSAKGGDPQPLAPISYQISFVGVGDNEDDIAPLSEKVQRLISQLHALFDLERLDGITFGAGFQAGVDGVARGFDTSAAVEAVPDDLAQGVSTLIVVHNGIPKVRVVLSVEYGTSLLADDVRNRETALHLLVAGLAQADTLLRFEKALPGFLMEPVYTSDHDGVLHCALRKALRAYRYARDSAEFGADEFVEQEFTKYMIHAFESAAAAIRKAKEDHAANPDFDKFMNSCVVAAGDMLTGSARLIGHRHGMEKFEFPDANSEVGAMISSRQLTSWIEVFAKDLRRFWHKGVWTRADFYALNIHAERMLWPYSIVLTRAPGGTGTLVYAPAADPPLTGAE